MKNINETLIIYFENCMMTEKMVRFKTKYSISLHIKNKTILKLMKTSGVSID